MNDEKLCKLIKSARIRSGQTQKEFGANINVSASTIKAWERNIVLPNFENLKSLCKYLNKIHDYQGSMEISRRYTSEKVDRL